MKLTITKADLTKALKLARAGRDYCGVCLVAIAAQRQLKKEVRATYGMIISQQTGEQIYTFGQTLNNLITAFDSVYARSIGVDKPCAELSQLKASLPMSFTLTPYKAAAR